MLLVSLTLLVLHLPPRFVELKQTVQVLNFSLAPYSASEALL